MQIWDTTGQEKFRSLCPLYYRDADAFILIFSFNSVSSFESIKDYWLPSLLNNGPSEVIVALVGTFTTYKE
jgi:GTPase SAR1 family protein